MKFYVTGEPYRRLRASFTNLNSFYIIDVDELLSGVTLDASKKSHRFIINSEIGRLITIASRSKRYNGIIYINSGVNCDAITGIRNLIHELPNDNIECMVILDHYDTPKMKDYYPLFDEVLFFPTYKRTRITECKPSNVS